MKSKIYILGASGSSSWSGSDGLWIRTAKLLVRKHQVCTISPLSKKTVLEHGLNPYRHIQLPALTKKPFLSRIALKVYGIGILACIKPKSNDVVLFSQGSIDTFFDAMYWRWLNRLRCKRISLTQLNTEIRAYPLGQVQAGKSFFKGTSTNVFVSQRNLDVAKRQFLYDFPNSRVIYNAPKFDLDQLPWPENDVIQLASVGRFEAETKGQLVLLESLAQLKHKPWALNIYGNGPDEGLIREAIKYFGLGERCSIHGYVNHPEEIWSSNHALVLFSSMEGFPLVIAEAMLSGRVCAVSDVGGNRELFEGQQMELISSPGSIPSTVATISTLLQKTTQELRELGNSNALVARRHHLNESMAVLANEIETLMDDEQY